MKIYGQHMVHIASQFPTQYSQLIQINMYSSVLCCRAMLTVKMAWLRELCEFMFVEPVALPVDPFASWSNTSSELETGTSVNPGIWLPRKKNCYRQIVASTTNNSPLETSSRISKTHWSLGLPDKRSYRTSWYNSTNETDKLKSKEKLSFI